MKKILIAVITIGLFAFIATSVNAQERYVAGGFEASGHVVTGAGYQHHNNQLGSEYAFDGDVGSTSGVLGRYFGLAAAPGTAAPGVLANTNDTFEFFIDEVELDIAKSFGENIRLRADLDFGRVASGSGPAVAFVLEQAYATANIPLGNGVEFLLGRFNTPIGFESVDVAENDTISKSILVRGMRPANTTGAKIYYAFSDLVDLHFYVVNTLYADSNVKINDIPSTGFRLGFNWGDPGTESTFGFSGLFGPESRVSNKHFTFGGDADLNWWLTESFALGLEALFVRSDAVTQTANITPGSNLEAMAGLLNLHYLFSDVWDGTLKYVFAKQYDGTASNAPNPMNLTGGEQAIHEIVLAGQYAVADAAKVKIEGRFDIVNPTGGGNTAYVYGGALAFAYDF